MDLWDLFLIPFLKKNMMHTYSPLAPHMMQWGSYPDTVLDKRRRSFSLSLSLPYPLDGNRHRLSRPHKRGKWDDLIYCIPPLLCACVYCMDPVVQEMGGSFNPYPNPPTSKARFYA